MSASSRNLILVSPDDGSILQRDGDFFVDASGNKYHAADVPDLRPLHSVRGNFHYRLLDHEVLRSYPYKRALEPFYPNNTASKDVKEENVSGFVPPPRPGAFCLDHGCGAGKMRSMLERLGYRYVGVDNEAGTTTGQGGGAGFKGGATHLGDLHRLPFADNTFQFAVSYSVFEHMQNPFVAASELYRVMEPGGVCWVGVGALVPFHMDSMFHVTFMGALALFTAAGFEVQQISASSWNGYLAISDMDGLPGPRPVRRFLSNAMYLSHRALWALRSRRQGKDPNREDLRRHLMMAGITKALLTKGDSAHLPDS